MGPWQELADALLDEDRLLRQRLADVPPGLRLRRGAAGELSCQETLGHIAYWDAYTVRFFRRKLATGLSTPTSALELDRASEEAVAVAAAGSWAEVMARYLEATGALIGFISNHWQDLSDKQREAFHVPLHHRRHHRAALEQLLDDLGDGGEQLAGQG